MTSLRRSSLIAAPLVLMAVLVGVGGCSDDDEPSDVTSGVIPSDQQPVSSGLPTTDGSPITTPAPNPNAGGAGAGDTATTAP
jgi:hypothetical protein